LHLTCRPHVPCQRLGCAVRGSGLGLQASPVDLENMLMAHPKVFEAVVIGIPHPKWQERPLACIVTVPGQTVTEDELKEFLKDKIASWWIPDKIALMDQLPKTSVGKFSKRALRELYAEGKIK